MVAVYGHINNNEKNKDDRGSTFTFKLTSRRITKY